MTPENQAKLRLVEAALDLGPVLVVLDARVQGVVVPDACRENPNLGLEFGHGLLIPIPDLVVDDAGIRCTLSFARTPFHVTVPWTAVHKVLVSYSMPGAADRGPLATPTQALKRTPARGHLKLVE